MARAARAASSSASPTSSRVKGRSGDVRTSAMAPRVRRRATIGTVSTALPPRRANAWRATGEVMASSITSGVTSSSSTGLDVVMLRRLGEFGGRCIT
jgi:hypothetical protein